ncbi:GreA/GreB family elongation factor [Photobacterium chitinilyticum]|uniref:Transcription elongation factor n=1 Tax=Photobacterium chitinilyticum TaxID=2485123 RepID=A0A3S3S077_9GAMM|nr:transcription elongation factor [Photobacterium chitinilyticum]RWX54775.1 transcription elongation factor [Photobacterium chitinilyticum]
MDKTLLLKHIVDKLKVVHQSAIDAATRAYETATDEENAPEHKYDTLSLEASYLAQGQALRVTECEDDLALYAKLDIKHFTSEDAISLGCLIHLIDDSDGDKFVFLGPAAGGLKISFSDKEIIIVTPSAPLGQALAGSHIDDEIEVHIGGERKLFDIVAIC